MKIPYEKIEILHKRAQKNLRTSKRLSLEIQGRGRFCPQCGSMNLEHNNKYPRFTGKAIICMTKCLTCGMLFDEPKYDEKPWVVFKKPNGGVMGFALEKEDIEDKEET